MRSVLVRCAEDNWHFTALRLLGLLLAVPLTSYFLFKVVVGFYAAWEEWSGRWSYGFAFRRAGRSLTIGLPHFVLALIATGTGTAPWLPFRFSLRTLLIAVTLVAITIGTIIATTS